jgi:DNA repair protein RadC
MKKINELEKFEKPREKLLEKGAKALKDYELVAVLLGNGVKGKDIIKLSREIVKLLKEEFNSINLEKLLKIHGLGTAKASQIISAIELVRDGTLNPAPLARLGYPRVHMSPSQTG